MRMIIVDDDVQIREGMRDGIDWADIGIDSVDCFGNVQEALEDMKMRRADIVITDIKMPGMSGIDFLKLIRETDADIRVILISGYADFQYAQEGLRYGARDYILKPIKARELIRVVQDTAEEIRMNRRSTQEQEIAQEVNREKFITDILEGKLKDRNILKENMNRYFQKDLGNYILLAVIETGNETGKSVEERLRESDDADNGKYFVYRTDEGRLLLICAASNSTIYNVNLQYSLLQEILAAGAKIAGISEVHAIEEIRTAYQESLKCMNLAFIKGKTGAYIYQERDYTERKPFDREQLQRELVKLLEKGEEHECFSWFEQFLNNTIENGMTDKAEMIQLICENLIYLKARMASGGTVHEELMPETIREQLGAAEFLWECVDIWKGIYQSFFDLSKGMNTAQYPPDIQEAVNFVYGHYREHISARTVAEHVGKSENYFRTYFKNTTGIALKDFINNCRIDQAERLLKHSNMYVYEIGEQVGFQDYAYFTKVFKKIKGYSPALIRKTKE